MFARRLAPEGTSSPPLLAHQLSGMSVEGGRAARRYSTVEDTDGMHTLVYARKCEGSVTFQTHVHRQHQPEDRRKAATLERQRLREHRC